MIQPEEVIHVQEWYTCDIPKKELKAFMKRDNYHAALYFGAWLVLLVATGYLAFRLLGTVWAVPAFLLYGVIYCGCNAVWHECSHGTPFKTHWLNEVFYFLCGTMELRDAVEFSWSHSRHHSYTIMTGIDPEIAVSRPPNLFYILVDFFYLHAGLIAIKTLILHSLGIPTKKAAEYVPEEEFGKMFWWARAALMLHLIAIGLAIATRSWLPVLYFGLPRFYGGFVHWTFILLQHVGLAENVWDHRLNTRSLHVNPFFSFLFMHMENHIDHHIYPLVPFYALPELHTRIADQLPRTYSSLWEGVKQLVPALLRQRKDVTYYIKRELPQPLSNI
jgi:fatty acid desaturase